ncbi:ParB/RepB/Spo0J family partition protein [Massilia sp. P8910]|uniref:ParB/RepB/Spo0J family partition protein n=1 Tax=Massilia antarctica TaxID=2765360 RepID=UPI001E4DF5E0|nr:ParB/RepB/Spo0J family partition protein [Massilia antarctica]MCE3608431.1 ParB/RepB/Spo0J family partition protein [Massilia antarctica]
MASKLQQRLAEKTTGIQRKAPPNEAGEVIGTASTMPPTVETDHVLGTRRSMSMPGQLGAFRLEAQKYETIIADLQVKLAAVNQGSYSVTRISLTLIDDSPYQPRLEIDPEEIDELAKTMAAAHQADPVKVRRVGDRFELISGHRRVRAARTLGWEEIDAIVEVRNDMEAEVEAMLLVVGNVHLSAYELAKMYDRAISKGIVPNQTACAAFFATKQPVVSACLGMLSLPQEIISILDAKPRLMGYECAKVVKALIKDHPAHLDTIIRGVSRLGEGMQQSALKGWVRQAIRQTTEPKEDDRRTITSNGRPVFTTKRDPRSVTVSCKIPGMDIEVFEERLRLWLHEQAKTVSELIGGAAT